jgi:hypothetical protein
MKTAATVMGLIGCLAGAWWLHGELTPEASPSLAPPLRAGPLTLRQQGVAATYAAGAPAPRDLVTTPEEPVPAQARDASLATPPVATVAKPVRTRWSPALTALGSPRLSRAHRRWDALLNYFKLDVDYQDLTLPDALAELSQRSGLPIHLSADARSATQESTVSLRLRDIRLLDVLRLTLSTQAGLAYSLADDGLHVSSCAGDVYFGDVFQTLPLEREADDRRALVSARAAQLDRLLTTSLVTVRFQETPLQQVLDFLRDVTGVTIVTSGGMDADSYTVTITRRNVPLGELLDLILEPHDLTRVSVQSLVRVLPKDDAVARAKRDEEEAAKRRSGSTVLSARFEAGASPLPLAAAAAALQAGTGMLIRLEGGAESSVASLWLPPGCTVEEACERATIQAGVRWSLRRTVDGGKLIHRVTWAGCHDALDALRASALSDATAAASAPAMAGVVSAAQQAARSLSELRERALQATDLAGLRPWRRDVQAANRRALTAVARAWAAADSLSATPSVAGAERAADLSAWLEAIAPQEGICRASHGGHCGKNRASDTPLLSPTPDDCLHHHSETLRAIAFWHVAADATAHPGAELLAR